MPLKPLPEALRAELDQLVSALAALRDDEIERRAQTLTATAQTWPDVDPDDRTYWVAWVTSKLGVRLADVKKPLARRFLAHERQSLHTLLHAGHPELEPALARSWNNLGAVLRDLGDREGALDAHGQAVVVLDPWVSGKRAFWLEGHLAGVWMRLVWALFSLHRFADAESELFKALDLLPHRPEVLHHGVRLYRAMVGIDDFALAEGGLPREEVDEGFHDLMVRVVRFQGDSLDALVALARHTDAVLGDTGRAAGILEGLARDRGGAEPQAWVELAAFRMEHGQAVPAWEATIESLKAVGALLSGERAGKRRRDDHEVRALVTLLLAGAGIAAEAGFRDGCAPEERSDAAWELRGLLEPVAQWQDVLLPPQHSTWAEMRATLDSRHAEAGKAVAAYRALVQERVLPLLEDRLEELKAQLDGISEQVASGAVSLDEAGRLYAERLSTLRETREVAASRSEHRGWVLQHLGVDPEAECPELHPLLTAVAIWKLMGERDPSAAKATLAMAGTAVEGALAERLFRPFLENVAKGTAQPCRALAPAADRPLMFTTMYKPWGKLVHHWQEDAEVAPLAEWVEREFATPLRLHNPRLDVLRRIGDLRNRGPHHAVEAPGRAEVEEMLRLTLIGDVPLLVELYSACFGGAPASGQLESPRSSGQASAFGGRTDETPPVEAHE